MNKDHYAFYGVALVAGAALAVSAGMAFALLLFLACPVMMLFMMKGVSGIHNSTPAPPTATPVTATAEEPKRL